MQSIEYALFVVRLIFQLELSAHGNSLATLLQTVQVLLVLKQADKWDMYSVEHIWVCLALLLSEQVSSCTLVASLGFYIDLLLSPV